VQQLRHLPTLQHLDVSQTAVTDAGLPVLRLLPALESLSLSMTGVTDAGMTHLRECNALRRVNLMWTRTGDGAIAALAGQSALTHFWSGNQVTDSGLALLHALPVFTSWRGEEPELEFFSYDAGPNLLSLRGSFTDDGMRQLSALNGLWGLNLDDSTLQLTAHAMLPLISLARLGRLVVDAKDDWMPHIAAMPALRFLGAQDTAAGDDGFEALSASQSIEYIWGRRCHNLCTRGFRALARMPKLRGLSVSCLNVGDDGVATLPQFPALRELMPMDVPDAGYRHIGRCVNLEALLLMYCRDTTDAATAQITGLSHLRRYFNSYTTITDRTPLLLSGMDSLEAITFDACHSVTDSGVAALARLPRLKELRVAGNGVTQKVTSMFGPAVSVHYSP
jgi:Leucine Rich repeat